MIDVQPDILEAFDAMWGLYPAPVLLIHKSREILAVNEKAKEVGVPAGIQCHSLYPSEKPCPHCKANVALAKNESVRRADLTRDGTFLDGYWIPVRGAEEIYVHFGNDITEFVKPELLTA